MQVFAIAVLFRWTSACILGGPWDSKSKVVITTKWAYNVTMNIVTLLKLKESRAHGFDFNVALYHVTHFKEPT